MAQAETAWNQAEEHQDERIMAIQHKKFKSLMAFSLD